MFIKCANEEPVLAPDAPAPAVAAAPDVAAAAGTTTNCRLPENLAVETRDAVDTPGVRVRAPLLLPLMLPRTLEAGARVGARVGAGIEREVERVGADVDADEGVVK